METCFSGHRVAPGRLESEPKDRYPLHLCTLTAHCPYCTPVRSFLGKRRFVLYRVWKLQFRIMTQWIQQLSGLAVAGADAWPPQEPGTERTWMPELECKGIKFLSRTTLQGCAHLRAWAINLSFHRQPGSPPRNHQLLTSRQENLSSCVNFHEFCNACPAFTMLITLHSWCHRVVT